MSGGSTFSDGSYLGLFGGPTVTAGYSPPNQIPNMRRGGLNPDGTPTTTSLSFQTGAIVVNGENVSFPLTLPPTSTSFFNGAVTERDLLLNFPSGETRKLKEIVVTAPGAPAPKYVRQFVYSATDPHGDLAVQAFMTIGSDTPMAPGATIATYKATTYGTYFNVKTGTSEKFFGSGTFKFDMATGDWSGSIADLDFTGAGSNLVTEIASDGRDFGLEFSGRLGLQNTFSGFVQATGLTLSGPVGGSFYGAKDGLAVEMGGQFYMLESTIPDGLISYVQGGFLGEYVPMSPGVSKSGGRIDDAGFVGDFRGPIAGLVSGGPSAPANSLAVIAGAPGVGGNVPEVSVKISERTGFGDEPRIDITIGSGQLTFDLNDADPYQYRSADRESFVVEEYVFNLDTANDRGSSLSIFNFNLGNAPGQEAGVRQAQYTRLAAFDRGVLSTNSLDTFLFMTFGSDAVRMPTTGSATFDTGLLGYYVAQNGVSPFTSRGDLLADFGALSVTGEFDPVTFTDFGGRLGVSPGITAFGLRLDATIVGDNFRGTMTAIGADMSGEVFGDFYGPKDAEPTEIGGAFAIGGTDGVAFGGFVGVAQ